MRRHILSLLHGYNTKKLLSILKILMMYTITIAIFHEVLGKNPGRISSKLIEYGNAFNWHDIDFPATYDDYITFERLSNIVALNVLYVPLNEINICPEYISKYNFDKRHQVVLLKIGDDKGK